MSLEPTIQPVGGRADRLAHRLGRDLRDLSASPDTDANANADADANPDADADADADTNPDANADTDTDADTDADAIAGGGLQRGQLHEQRRGRAD